MTRQWNLQAERKPYNVETNEPGRSCDPRLRPLLERRALSGISTGRRAQIGADCRLSESGHYYRRQRHALRRDHLCLGVSGQPGPGPRTGRAARRDRGNDSQSTLCLAASSGRVRGEIWDAYRQRDEDLHRSRCDSAPGGREFAHHRDERRRQDDDPRGGHVGPGDAGGHSELAEGGFGSQARGQGSQEIGRPIIRALFGQEVHRMKQVFLLALAVPAIGCLSIAWKEDAGLALKPTPESRALLAQAPTRSGKLTLIPYRLSGDGSDRLQSRWGYCDPTKRLVLEARYGDAEPFSDGLARVVRNGKWGYIDESGREVVPCKYDDIDDFHEGLAVAQRDGNSGYVDKSGKEVIPFTYFEHHASAFSEGLARVEPSDFMVGYIDRTGKEVIPARYDAGESFSEGLAAVGMESGDHDKWGFIDKSGRLVIPFRYDRVEAFANGLAKVERATEAGFKAGLIDRTGKVVAPLKYDELGEFSEGLARVKRGERVGFIDRRGKEVIALKYRDASPSFSEGLAYVETVSGQGLYIDKAGKKVLAAPYFLADPFYEGMAAVRLKKQRTSGYIDRTGKVVVPLKYDHTGRFSEGLGAVERNGKVGYVDKTGKVVIPLKYEYGTEFSGALATVKLNGKYGYIGRDGAEYFAP